jgi:AI-2 transport protein TqsA
VPLAFTFLLWAVLNAMTDVFARFNLPRWLAWSGTVAILAAALYLIVRVISDEAADFAAQAPAYATRLQELVTRLTPKQLDIHIDDLFSRADVSGAIASVATALGSSLLGLFEVLIFVGFLLAEQNSLATRLAAVESRRPHSERRQVLNTIAGQVRSYLIVCTYLSAVMAAASYALLSVLGVPFAGFSTLLIFLLTYIPTVGAVGVLIPALLAFFQSGSLEAPLIIIAVLGTLHFVLMNVAATLWLGQSLNLSPFVILVALTFWGLVWGIPGLFLAVPATGAAAIICAHIDGLRWVSVLLAGPPHAKRRPAATALAEIE